MNEFDKRAERLDKQLAELDRRKRLFDKQAEIRSVKSVRRHFLAGGNGRLNSVISPARLRGRRGGGAL